MRSGSSSAVPSRRGPSHCRRQRVHEPEHTRRHRLRRYGLAAHGAQQVVGQGDRETVQALVDYWNAHGGINGRKLVVDIVNDAKPLWGPAFTKKKQSARSPGPG